MNILSVVLLGLIMFLQPKYESYLIISGKSIQVDGQTSIGGFSCNYNTSGQNDTLFLNGRDGNPYHFKLYVPKFQCGNYFLNKDFQSTLKADQYPDITLKVSQLKKTAKGEIIGRVNLQLVGKTKVLDNIRFSNYCYNGQNYLSAKISFSSKEFELTPPKRLGGLIKTEDTLKITVELLYSEAG